MENHERECEKSHLNFAHSISEIPNDWKVNVWKNKTGFLREIGLIIEMDQVWIFQYKKKNDKISDYDRIHGVTLKGFF
jgi:hypothetical protein